MPTAAPSAVPTAGQSPPCSILRRRSQYGVRVLQATPPPPEGPRGDRTPRRRLRYAVTGVLVLALAGYLLLRWVSGGAAERCTVRGGSEEVRLDPSQAANAATIAAVASSRGLPERAVTIALATAMQESELENIDHGDRDSLGLFQQRPSQGWGTERQILDPVYSANEFYEALEDVPGYSRLPLTVAAQKVQKSGFPQAYAKHEADASVLAAALTGREARALTCTLRPRAESAAGDAKRVGERVAREFGKASGTVAREGRTLRYHLGDVELERAEREALGSALAAWAVAHAKELNVERVVHGNTVWSAAESDEGWRKNSQGAADTVSITVNG